MTGSDNLRRTGRPFLSGGRSTSDRGFDRGSERGFVREEKYDPRFLIAIHRVMERAALAAGESLVHDFGEIEHLQISVKGPGDFASRADHRAEEIVCEQLIRAYPEFSIIGEESGHSYQGDGSGSWIVDPLDGTFNFLHGVPHFGVSIALEIDGEVVAGIVYDPAKHELFAAQIGEGATMNNRRLRVSGRREMSESIISYGIATSLRETDDGTLLASRLKDAYGYPPALRRLGASALDLVYVAAGRFDGFWTRGMQSWDIAAGVLIVREAAGRVSLHGEQDFSIHNVPNGGVLLAGNDAVAQMLERLLPSFPSPKTSQKSKPATS